MHAVSTNQIADILHYNDKAYYKGNTRINENSKIFNLDFHVSTSGTGMLFIA